MYNKLVRDKIPEIISNNGEKPIIKTLSDDEYKKELELKLKEEVDEVLNSFGDDRIEELGDVLEVMISLALIEGKTLEDITKSCDLKREKRGGFKDKVYLIGVNKK